MRAKRHGNDDGRFVRRVRLPEPGSVAVDGPSRVQRTSLSADAEWSGRRFRPSGPFLATGSATARIWCAPIAPTRSDPTGGISDHSDDDVDPVEHVRASVRVRGVRARDVPESAAPRPPNRSGADARCSRTTGGRDPGVGSGFRLAPIRIFAETKFAESASNAASSTSVAGAARRRVSHRRPGATIRGVDAGAPIVVSVARGPSPSRTSATDRISYDDFGASDPDVAFAADTRTTRAAGCVAAFATVADTTIDGVAIVPAAHRTVRYFSRGGAGGGGS